MKTKKEQETIEKLKLLQTSGDAEMAHSEADELLCQFLKRLGYKRVVDEWKKVPKWYA